MVSFFTTTLLISIAGIVVLMILKQIELSTGTVLFSVLRPRINRFFKTCLVLIERVLPALAHEGVVGLFRHLRGFVQRLLAHGLLRFEAWLKHMLQLIREKTHPTHARGEASAFLKEVGEYKKQLEAETKDELAGEEKAL